ncbi:galactose oxidase [Mycena amicta]|nr:galactose oxidase [Mycena amicta]
MAKKKSGNKAEKTAAKKAKATQKTERKVQKKAGKQKEDSDDDDDQDLEAILEKVDTELRVEWEEAHKVTEEVADGPPSRRANCSLTPCPSGSPYLWAIGGEFFSEDGKAYFYSDVYRYSADKSEWRKFTSPICPGPRSAHAVAASPAGGGKLFLFGTSVNQNSFHHYRDFWCFDVQLHSWDRIETKVRPSARSGHRMAMWKHFIVLFGGFYDPGTTTKYLNDLWLFDLQDYKWRQAEFKETELRPSHSPARYLLGGYCKEYAKGKRPVGVMLEDTWFLKCALLFIQTHHSSNHQASQWRRAINRQTILLKRPSTAYAPALRSGATMTLWPAKNMGIMFGGVTDVDQEETLESTFWNDLWVKLAHSSVCTDQLATDTKLRAKEDLAKSRVRVKHDEEDDSEVETPEIDPDDPILTTPASAIQRDARSSPEHSLHRGKREYTMDDFYSIQLDKLERYSCLKKNEIVIAEDDEESSDDDDSEDDGEDDDDDDIEEEEDREEQLNVLPVEEQAAVDSEGDQTDLRAEAAAFMGVAKERSAEDSLSTPLPGETLAMFYARSRTYWAQKAHATTENQGKQLRRDGFSLAEETYKMYLPILKEVEKILAEAGLDEQEMRNVGQAQRGDQSRNRR